MTLTEEKQLIKKAKSEPEAFAALYDRYYRKIFGYVHRRVIDFDISKDITSEVFLKAFMNLWKFRWQGISISAWFYRIAINEINYYFRKKRYAPRSLDSLLDKQGFNPDNSQLLLNEKNEIEQKLQDYQDFLLIQSSLKQLSLKYQEVISLKYFEEKSIKEICEILNKKEGTVKSLISTNPYA